MPVTLVTEMPAGAAGRFAGVSIRLWATVRPDTPDAATPLPRLLVRFIRLNDGLSVLDRLIALPDVPGWSRPSSRREPAVPQVTAMWPVGHEPFVTMLCRSW